MQMNNTIIDSFRSNRMIYEDVHSIHFISRCVSVNTSWKVLCCDQPAAFVLLGFPERVSSSSIQWLKSIPHHSMIDAYSQHDLYQFQGLFQQHPTWAHIAPAASAAKCQSIMFFEHWDDANLSVGINCFASVTNCQQITMNGNGKRECKSVLCCFRSEFHSHINTGLRCDSGSDTFVIGFITVEGDPLRL